MENKNREMTKPVISPFLGMDWQSIVAVLTTYFPLIYSPMSRVRWREFRKAKENTSVHERNSDTWEFGKGALSANQRFFRQVLGTKERLRRFFQRTRRWNVRKKIFERRRASFFETSSERLEAKGEISNVEVQMPNN